MVPAPHGPDALRLQPDDSTEALAAEALADGDHDDEAAEVAAPPAEAPKDAAAPAEVELFTPLSDNRALFQEMEKQYGQKKKGRVETLRKEGKSNADITKDLNVLSWSVRAAMMKLCADGKPFSPKAVADKIITKAVKERGAKATAAAEVAQEALGAANKYNTATARSKYEKYLAQLGQAIAGGQTVGLSDLAAAARDATQKSATPNESATPTSSAPNASTSPAVGPAKKSFGAKVGAFLGTATGFSWLAKKIQESKAAAAEKKAKKKAEGRKPSTEKPTGVDSPGQSTEPFRAGRKVSTANEWKKSAKAEHESGNGTGAIDSAHTPTMAELLAADAEKQRRKQEKKGRK